jgi:signal peptidase I
MMEANFFQRHPFLKDAIGVLIFIVFIVLGTIFINTFIFRSFNVVGPSMEPTLHTGDRLIVNRLPVTLAQIQNKDYIPQRGQIIVFKNPRYNVGMGDEYIVKRVIGLPGEHVTIKDGKYVVYNHEHSEGFNPDDANHGEPGLVTSGTADEVVPAGELFVSGDHRDGTWSFDSRNGEDGLGTIPLYDVVGPVSMRIFPINKMRFF